MIGKDLNIFNLIEKIETTIEAQKSNLTEEQKAELDEKLKDANIDKLKYDLHTKFSDLQKQLEKLSK